MRFQGTAALPALRKNDRRITSHLRHMILSAGMTGTKSFLVRAGRYSVRQLIKSFSALFAALLIIPQMLKSISFKETGGSSTTGGLNGIASFFRGVFTAAKSLICGLGTALYHIPEMIQSLLRLLIGTSGGFNKSICHGICTIKTSVVGFADNVQIYVCHLCGCLQGVFVTFKTGTCSAMDTLRSREKKLKTNVFRKFVEGRDYISRTLTTFVCSVGCLFAFLWDKTCSVATLIRNKMTSTKVIVDDIGHKTQHAGLKIQSVVLDVVHSVKKMASKAPAIGSKDSSNGAKENERIAIKVKTLGSPLQVKASELMQGVKVGSISVMHKLHEGSQSLKEKVVFYVKASAEGFVQRKRLVQRKVISGIEDGILAARIAQQRATMKLAYLGKLTWTCILSESRVFGKYIIRVSKLVTAPIVYLYELPGRTLWVITHTTMTSYTVMVALLGFIIYLLHAINHRFSRETYARNVGVNRKVRNGCQELNLTDSVLRQCMEKLRSQIELGLNPATKEKASVKCFNTYVQDLPTGKEKGQFLALDLGGTNFRVLLITLNGRHFDMQSKIYVVPKDIMTGPGEELFEHIASCLESFTLQHRVANKNLPLGFTFSFPLNQIGLKSGILQRWTKGFNCANTVGKDVVQMLNDAIRKRGTVKIDVVAILNDTTGTLMSCAWKNHNCKVGVILGTGSNACYVEKIENVIGFDGDTSKNHVIINTEWGAFGDNGELDFIRTPYDNEIDKHSVNPGKQLHEKMVSGMYLGELVRLLIVKFTKDKVLFGGDLCPELQERWNFLTEYISEIESDPRGVFKQCRNVLGKIGILNPTDQDCSNIRYICESVSRRAAHLASAGVATLINKMNIPSITVGVDGSLYRYHPHFHNLMHEKIPELCNPSIENLNINLMLSEDGSGRGAALIAASGSEYKE